MAPAPQAADGMAGESQLPHLFSPLQVGPHLIRNRVLITAHVPRLADDGAPGARYVAYHRARARGGAGLQITGATPVHRSSDLGAADALDNTDDSVIPGYQDLAEAVHGEGGELVHAAAALDAPGLVEKLRGRRHVSHAQTRRDDLGKRSDVHDHAPVVQGVDGGHVLALVAQIDVAVVLEDRHSGRVGDLQHLLTPLQRHRKAERILEGRYRVDYLGRLAV